VLKKKTTDTKNFKSLNALQPVVNVVNEAGAAIQDKGRTIENSEISGVLSAVSGVLGAGIGGVVSFTALYGAGVVGLSAAGITSALAAIGGTMVAGIFVLAVPIVGFAFGGMGILAAIKRKQLRQEKERLLIAAVENQDAISTALKDEVDATKDRTDYLNSLNILLQRAISDLRADLKMPEEDESDSEEL